MNPNLDAHGVVDLCDVEVDPEGDGDEVGEEEDEAEEVEVPGAVEALQAHHDHREDDGGGEQDLGQVVELLVEQPDLGVSVNEHILKIRICLIHPPAHLNIRIYSNMGPLVCKGLQNDPY